MRVEDGVEIREPGDSVRHAVTIVSREIDTEFPEKRILETTNLLLGWAASCDIRPIEFASERLARSTNRGVADLVAIGLKGIQIGERGDGGRETSEGWISVKERVPEENGMYPVFGMDTRGRKVRTLADWDARDNRWYTIDYGYHGEWTTHWAEWPEDPV